MLKESNISPEARTLIQDFAARQKFPLDPFQMEAMASLVDGRSVLVSAPTGSGKTIVAEFAIFHARALDKRCIYTTPLKALSNQKYRDLRQDMGDDVGLVTGDVVINPEAPVLIMTTEILRNILQADPARVDDVAHVVLDEAHYMGSEGRGTVWEETIVFLGKHTSIVALSATIPNADELATWVSAVHKPMDVIYHAERPVPLEPFVALEKGKVEALFDKRGKLRVKSFKPGDEWLEPPLSSEVVRELHKKEMLPAIFFVFSRLGCEKEALAVIRSGIKLTTPKEQKLIQKAIDEAVAQTPTMITSQATKGWLERLVYGVAPHHAGLLPPLKLLIEVLFQRNLLKLVFATETLAAGINMPARTVVITSLSKRTDEGHRLLTVSEFAQMTGRAGRRGMDTVGYGVVLASHRYKVHDVAALFKGEAEPLRSRFTLNFNMVANLVHNYEEAQARRIVEQCFSQFQNNATITQLHALQEQTKGKLKDFDPACPRFPDEHLRGDLLDRYKTLKKDKEDTRTRVVNLEAGRSYLKKEDAVRAIKQAPFHSWVIVQQPNADRPELGVLLDKYPVKSGDVQFTVLLENNVLTRLSLRHLILPLNAPVKGIPGELAKRADKLSFQQTERLKEQALPWQKWLDQAGIVPADVIPDMSDPPELVKAKASYAETLAEFESHQCFNCKHFAKCRDVHKDQSRVSKDVLYYQEQIDAIRGKYWRQFKTLQNVLEDALFLRGRELLPRGVALANLRTNNELLASEVFASGLLETLNPVELCAVTSAIVAEPIRGRMNWHPLRVTEGVFRAVDEVNGMAGVLLKILKRHGVEEETPLYVTGDYVGMVQAWAEAAEWAHVIELSGVDEGQLVRHMRQLIDMLRQFKDVPGNAESFREKCLAALALVDRDIVQEVF